MVNRDHEDAMRRWIILWIEGVRYGLISTVHPREGGRDRVVALGSGRHDARGGARGGSPKLSLALAPVAHSTWGLHLHDLRRTGILTEVLAIVGVVGRRMEMRRRTWGIAVQSWGSCGAPPTLVLLPAVAVMSPLPWWPIGRGQGATKWRGDSDA
jgi:hypothetical protein